MMRGDCSHCESDEQRVFIYAFDHDQREDVHAQEKGQKYFVAIAQFGKT